jgi:hypothetical protein
MSSSESESINPKPVRVAFGTKINPQIKNLDNNDDLPDIKESESDCSLDHNLRKPVTYPPTQTFIEDVFVSSEGSHYGYQDYTQDEIVPRYHFKNRN